MPLGILLILVAGGITGIVLLLHLTGHSRPFEIDGEATARREWLRHNPGDEIREAHVAPGGRAALIVTTQGAGLLWSFGADTTAHDLRRARVRQVRRGLRVIFGDFAAPSVTLRLPPEARAHWAARIEGAAS
ncbi:hypothetical protein [Acidimangrovimonas pyrenivorans]|uniref:Uncharacterized protein n=1 Tax=Acidimangrovimonas pyrenivorans TaxID=2030798 RepID=A0ABV7ALV0_9RHOB